MCLVIFIMEKTGLVSCRFGYVEKADYLVSFSVSNILGLFGKFINKGVEIVIYLIAKGKFAVIAERHLKSVLPYRTVSKFLFHSMSLITTKIVFLNRNPTIIKSFYLTKVLLQFSKVSSISRDKQNFEIKKLFHISLFYLLISGHLCRSSSSPFFLVLFRDRR